MKEKGYSIREKRVTENEFNRKMEIETKMAEDKEQEDQRLAKIKSMSDSVVKKPMSSALKRVIKQGAVKRPQSPRIGNRGF